MIVCGVLAALFVLDAAEQTKQGQLTRFHYTKRKGRP
jgi:hypothetical protein